MLILILVFSSNFIVHIVALKMDWLRKAFAWINIFIYHILFSLLPYLYGEFIQSLIMKYEIMK